MNRNYFRFPPAASFGRGRGIISWEKWAFILRKDMSEPLALLARVEAKRFVTRKFGQKKNQGASV